MAVVLTGIVADFKRVPYVKPPDMQRLYTAMPRALVYFTVVNSTIPAKPASDQQNIQVATDLPTEFAYRMVSAIIDIRQDVADDWDANGIFEVTNAMRSQELGQINRHAITSSLANTFAPIIPERMYRVDPIPTYIMQSLQRNVAPTLDFRLSNQGADAGATGFIQFFASFLEYDLEQVQMFPPLFPQLTYAIA